MSISGIGQSQNAYTPAGSSQTAAASKASDVKAEFMKWAQMTPAQRMHANLLASMGLDEDKLAAMSDKEREKVEAKIREMIEEKIKQGDRSPGQLVDKKV
jgi:TPP-dependent pyruvate/acetoin dehydrogenase alpha subunit